MHMCILNSRTGRGQCCYPRSRMPWLYQLPRGALRGSVDRLVDIKAGKGVAIIGIWFISLLKFCPVQGWIMSDIKPKSTSLQNYAALPTSTPVRRSLKVNCPKERPSKLKHLSTLRCFLQNSVVNW